MSSKRRAVTGAGTSQSLEGTEGPASKRRKTQVCLLRTLCHVVWVDSCGCVVVLKKYGVWRRNHGHGHRLSLGPQGFGPVNSTAICRAICLLMQPPFQLPTLPILTHTMADTEFPQGRRGGNARGNDPAWYSVPGSNKECPRQSVSMPMQLRIRLLEL